MKKWSFAVFAVVLWAIVPNIVLATPTTNPSVATFDDLPVGYLGTSFGDSGINFTDAYTLYNLTNRGLAIYAVESAANEYPSPLSGFTPPNIVTFGTYGSNGYPSFGAAQSFSFNDGAPANRATATLFTAGPAGNEVTLEGLQNGVVISTVGFSVSSTFGDVHTLTVSGGPFDGFEVTSTGPSLNGMTYLAFDTVSISVPEPGSITICGMFIAFATMRRRSHPSIHCTRD
jgi:hypothetical protein